MAAVAKPVAAVYASHADSERVRFEAALLTAGVLVIRDGAGRLCRGGDRWYGSNAAATIFELDKPVANRDHPTMKPVALIEAILANSLRPAGIVLCAPRRSAGDAGATRGAGP